METDTKITQMLQLVDNSFKSALINMLKVGKEQCMMKRQKTKILNFCLQNRILFCREIEIIKKK